MNGVRSKHPATAKRGKGPTFPPTSLSNCILPSILFVRREAAKEVRNRTRQRSATQLERRSGICIRLTLGRDRQTTTLDPDGAKGGVADHQRESVPAELRGFGGSPSKVAAGAWRFRWRRPKPSLPIAGDLGHRVDGRSLKISVSFGSNYPLPGTDRGPDEDWLQCRPTAKFSFFSSDHISRRSFSGHHQRDRCAHRRARRRTVESRDVVRHPTLFHEEPQGDTSGLWNTAAASPSKACIKPHWRCAAGHGAC